MNRNLPNPTGNDAETEHHREIYRQVNREMPLRSSSRVKVQRTTTGTFLRISQRPAGSLKTSGGMNWRGTWVSTTAYGINDLVSLGLGTSAGTYLSTISANTNPPDSGIGWIQISSFATWL